MPPSKIQYGDKIAGVTYPIFIPIVARAWAPQQARNSPPLANLRAWLEFAPSRNPDALPGYNKPRNEIQT
ncbi:hypothetical protein SBA3_2770003 [Candidatus Sulfopaludibacter sp. SbA3]|nr:hypothetical protein SBA3_2770003 [Candidatus Sulfopaludibacter sp. SbA3]